MKEEYYEIKKHPYTFYAIVLIDKNSGLNRVKFGGTVGCVIFSIYDDEDNPNLDGLSYGKNCAINQVDPRDGLLPSIGTVTMAQSAIAFVNSIFPGKGPIFLKDQSKITCNKNKTLSLQHYYLAKHLKTWYEAKLGAKLVDSNQEIKYEKLIKFLKSNLTESFEDFVSKYVKPVVSEIQFKSLVPILQEYYENAKTYHEFLHNLADDKDCIIFDKWLFKFMVDNSNYNSSDAFWSTSSNCQITYKKIKKKPAFNFVIFGGRDPDAEPWMG